MIIAIDYDGTISDTNREKVKWIEENIGNRVSPWECSRTECVPIIGRPAYEKMGAYVYERASTLQAHEIKGALQALRILAGRASLYIVTARPQRRVAYAREWLEKKGVLPCFHGIHTSHGSTKTAICASLGANVLIDDDVRHLLTKRGDGLHQILLQAGRILRPEYGKMISFCSSWQDVLQKIGQL